MPSHWLPPARRDEAGRPARPPTLGAAGPPAHAWAGPRSRLWPGRGSGPALPPYWQLPSLNLLRKKIFLTNTRKKKRKKNGRRGGGRQPLAHQRLPSPTLAFLATDTRTRLRRRRRRWRGSHTGSLKPARRPPPARRRGRSRLVVYIDVRQPRFLMRFFLWALPLPQELLFLLPMLAVIPVYVSCLFTWL